MTVAAPAPAPPAAPSPPAANREPDSNITAPRDRSRGRAPRRFSGTASDDRGVRRVEIALVRVVGSALAARVPPRCLGLKSNGRFRRTSPRRRRCAVTGFLAASGARRWSFTPRRRLPPGRYALYSRAIDSDRRAERSFSRRDRNRVTFTVR